MNLFSIHAVRIRTSTAKSGSSKKLPRNAKALSTNDQSYSREMTVTGRDRQNVPPDAVRGIMFAAWNPTRFCLAIEFVNLKTQANSRTEEQALVIATSFTADMACALPS